MRAALMDSVLRRYGGSIGASATIYREPGQARKGAAEAVDLCAGVLLVESPPEFQIGVRPQDISPRQMHWGLTPDSDRIPCCIKRQKLPIIGSHFKSDNKIL